MTIRPAYHEGKAGKNFAYPADHNDRSYDYRKKNKDGEHIIAEEVQNDVFWDYKDGFIEPGNHTFKNHEVEFYQETFGDHLEKQNQRYKAKGKKTKTMNDYYRSKRSCPHEVVFYLGGNENHESPEKILEVWQAQMEWEQKQFPNVKYLNYALHVDEQVWDEDKEKYIRGAPQIHARKVYVATDRYGDKCEEVERCLAQSGVEFPDPNEKGGRYNNRKKEYTRECREHLLQLCRERGIDIEETPRDPSESGRNKEEFIRNKKLKEENKKLEEENRKLEEKMQETSRNAGRAMGNAFGRTWARMTNFFRTIGENYQKKKEENEQTLSKQKETIKLNGKTISDQQKKLAELQKDSEFFEAVKKEKTKRKRQYKFEGEVAWVVPKEETDGGKYCLVSLDCDGRHDILKVSPEVGEQIKEEMKQTKRPTLSGIARRTVVEDENGELHCEYDLRDVSHLKGTRNIEKKKEPEPVVPKQTKPKQTEQKEPEPAKPEEDFNWEKEFQKELDAEGLDLNDIAKAGRKMAEEKEEEERYNKQKRKRGQR